MIAVQAKEGYLPRVDDETGQRVKEDKNPRVSMNINLPGRYTIFTPMEAQNQISRRIRDKKAA